MAIRNILDKNESRLRKKSREVKKIDGRMETLIEDMWETMYEAHGVGLAAPQVGVLRRVVVIDTSRPEPAEEDAGAEDSYDEGEEQEEDVAEEEPFKAVLINPVITDASDEFIIAPEGCLSVPGHVGLVSRPEWVKVSAMDESGEVRELLAEGFAAKAVCHELDHLEGVLFTDIEEPPEEGDEQEFENVESEGVH